MNAERYRLEVSGDVLQAIQDAVVIRKVDVEASIRESGDRAQRARAAHDDELATMAETMLSENRSKLVAIEAARHAVFSARRSADTRIARLAAKRVRR